MTPTERFSAEFAAVGADRFTAPDYKPGEVVHIVLFRLGASVNEADRAELVRRFLALEQTCRRDGRPYIREIVAGAANGGEGAERGFELGFVLRFASEGDRNFYAGVPNPTDPAHEAFKAFAGPMLATEGVLVFDFSTGRP